MHTRRENNECEVFSIEDGLSVQIDLCRVPSLLTWSERHGYQQVVVVTVVDDEVELRSVDSQLISLRLFVNSLPQPDGKPIC